MTKPNSQSFLPPEENTQKPGNESGQTLIETLVAVFILVMGVTAAVGLANYALGASTNISKQIIATGLAREGIEALKNMRDTNWLKESYANNCYNYASGNNDANCYPQWLTEPGCAGQGSDKGYCLDPGATPATYVLDSQTDSTKKFWDFSPENTGFAMNFNASGNTGFYHAAKSVNGNAIYYRMITLTKISNPPYRPNLEELQVLSQVWWSDKNCPPSTTFAASTAACRIELQTFLTNWKNY